MHPSWNTFTPAVQLHSATDTDWNAFGTTPAVQLNSCRRNQYNRNQTGTLWNCLKNNCWGTNKRARRTAKRQCYTTCHQHITSQHGPCRQDYRTCRTNTYQARNSCFQGCTTDSCAATCGTADMYTSAGRHQHCIRNCKHMCRRACTTANLRNNNCYKDFQICRHNKNKNKATCKRGCDTTYDTGFKACYENCGTQAKNAYDTCSASA